MLWPKAPLRPCGFRCRLSKSSRLLFFAAAFFALAPPAFAQESPAAAQGAKASGSPGQKKPSGKKAGKYQVCSITINSADEIQLFKKYLPASQFEFAELLPQDKQHYAKHDFHWFNEACRKPYKCDILVISGHFGGTFFGESGFSLPTNLMERRACRSSCGGILSRAKEIFLFGCNTLASKKRDSRTSSEYLQVLLDDGLAREMAERVVAARYTPLEAPFYRRMNFVFQGSKVIYGFDQLSPLGKNIRGPLSKYFQSINGEYGSYKNYMDSKGYERPRNTNLFAHLNHTTLSQAHLSLAAEDQNARAFFKDKCLLYNESAPFSQRMGALKNIFHSGNSGSAFFALDHFLERQMGRILEGDGGGIFRSVRQSESFSGKFQSYYAHLRELPYIKLVYLNLLQKFQWIDPSELRDKRKKDLLQLISAPDSEAYVSVLLLAAENRLKPGVFYFSKNDLPADYFRNIWSLLILERLQAEAPDWQPAILDFCEKNISQKPPILCYQALNTLAHIRPTPETAKRAARFLDHGDSGLIYYGLRAMGQSGASDRGTHLKISSFLGNKDPHIGGEALEALGFLASPYEDIQEAVSRRLLPSGSAAPDRAWMEKAAAVLWTLSRMNIQSEKAAEDIVSHSRRFAAYAEKASSPKKAERHRKMALAGIKAFQNTSPLPLFVLDYFYGLLEDFENLPPALAAIDTFCGMKARDIGVYYRITRFYEHPQAKARKAVLKRLSRCAWFHPAAQRELAMFLFDDDKEVRRLASAVYRNLSNITEDSHELIQSYSGSNPEIAALAKSLSGG